MSPGNPVKFNQSEDDIQTPEVFPDKCAICIRRLANGPWGVSSEAETSFSFFSFFNDVEVYPVNFD